ncbi:MAG TPA: phosphotransferase, partial [Acidimicrobiia bacterium]
ATANGPTIHRFLRHLASTGLDIAPEPLAWEPGGRERLRFILGDVPIPPYPAWAQSDETLASMAVLMRALHDGSRTFVRDEADVWSGEWAAGSEHGDSVICHNDVCLENVVFRSGVAVALLDFEFAAPGSRNWDLACFARMCVPIDDEVNRERLGWHVRELPARLRLIADAYGCVADERRAIAAGLEPGLAAAEAWVRARVEAGDPGVVRMWEASGGPVRFDRRRAWWDRHRDEFVAAMA